MLNRAQADAMRPIPVVLNLSSRAAQRKPLTEWLVDELNQHYNVPLKVGQAWVDGAQLLPLLDGLDEGARTEGVTAIRESRLHPLCNMVRVRTHSVR